MLAVEVVSPSSVLRDRETKRALYARAGVPSYWLIEPDEKALRIRLTEVVAGTAEDYLRGGIWESGVFQTDKQWTLEIDLDALNARWTALMRRGGAYSVFHNL